MIRKGTWVQIKKIVLNPEERSEAIPLDTKTTPLKMWVKGYCREECNIGDEIEIETVTGRSVKGIVVMEKPSYSHGFGEYVDEIVNIGPQAKKILSEE